METFRESIIAVDRSNVDRRTFLVATRSAVALGVFHLFSHPSAAQQPEKVRSAAIFSGNESGIKVPDLMYDGTYPLTVEAYVHPSSVDGEKAVFSNHQNAGVALLLKDGYWEFLIHNGAQYLRARSDAKVIANREAHLMGVCDGRTVHLFVDGQLQKIASPCIGKHKISQQPFYVGAEPNAGGQPVHCFQGSIRDVKMTAFPKNPAHTLTLSERKTLKKHELLVLPLDEGKGVHITDRSAFRRNLDAQGMTWKE